jgi:anti-sigma regulatory factor (Ser/Thr protein kinase)
MCLTRQRDYPADPRSVAMARDFVAAFVVATLDPRGWALADDAALLVSEFVSSAVETGCTRVEVRVDLHADRLELTVTGHGAQRSAGHRAAQGAAQDAGGASGAGIHGPPSTLRTRLVEGIAERAEVRRDADGTVIGMARLPCRRSWTAGVPCEETDRTGPRRERRPDR